MFAIELSFGQKIQVAFILAVLGIAGFMFFRAARGQGNQSVTAWTETRDYGTDSSKPMGPNNPKDPKKQSVVYVFACADGRLKIKQFTFDQSAGTTITFQNSALQAGVNHAAFNFFASWENRIKKISDPYKHTLAMAAYNAADGKMLGLLGFAHLTPDQLDTEKKARATMLADIKATDLLAEAGGFQKSAYNKTISALDTYKTMAGDPGLTTPNYNPKKADAAREVIRQATEYMAMIEEEESTKVEKYIAAIDAILSPEQKGQLAEGGKQYMASSSARGNAPPRGNLMQTQPPRAGAAGAMRGNPPPARGPAGR